MTLVESIRNLLLAAGLTSVYIVDSPDSSDTVMIAPYASSIEDGPAVGRQHMQLRAAGTTFTASEALCWRAFNALEGKAPTGADRNVLGAIVTEQEPYFLGREDDGRYIHVFNFSLAAELKGAN